MSLILPHQPSTTAFSENISESKSPIIQLEFPYGINDQEVSTFLNNGGSVTQIDGKAHISSGTSTNASACFFSKVTAKYNPGQGTLVMFTALFTPGKLGSKQIIGIGNTSDLYGFGVKDTQFGIWRLSEGSVESQELVITAGASATGNITITIDGTAINIGVTISDTIEEVIDKIHATSFASVTTGWDVHKFDNTTVRFVSFSSKIFSGTMNFSAGSTGVVADSFVETLTGKAPLENFIPQPSWNLDQMNFDKVAVTGSSRTNNLLDITKGNIYKIQYQWLGFGGIKFFIEDSRTGEFVPVHTIQYANKNTNPSVLNPNFPVSVFVENTTNDTDIVIETSSMAAFNEGMIRQISNVRHAADNIQTLDAGVESNILTLHNKQLYLGKSNRIKIFPDSITLSTDGTKPVTFRFYINANVTGDVTFIDIDTQNSVIQTDIVGTTITGGVKLLTLSLGKNASDKFFLNSLNIILYPQEKLIITAESAVASDVSIGVSWREDF